MRETGKDTRHREKERNRERDTERHNERGRQRYETKIAIMASDHCQP